MDDKETENILDHWEPGTEITSEAHYMAMTNQLAQVLLKENTLEQLAVIAAQHLIYVDALNDRIDSMKRACGSTAEIIRIQDEQLRLAKTELRSMLTTREAAQMARLVLDAKHKQRARIAALASHKEDHAGMAAALADWDSNGAKYSSRRAFARAEHHLYGARDSDTVYRWLLKYRPLISKALPKTKPITGFRPSKARGQEDF